MEKQIEEIIASTMEIVDETETFWNNVVQKLKNLEERVKALEAAREPYGREDK